VLDKKDDVNGRIATLSLVNIDPFTCTLTPVFVVISNSITCCFSRTCSCLLTRVLLHSLCHFYIRGTLAFWASSCSFSFSRIVPLFITSPQSTYLVSIANLPTSYIPARNRYTSTERWKDYFRVESKDKKRMLQARTLCRPSELCSALQRFAI